MGYLSNSVKMNQIWREDLRSNQIRRSDRERPGRGAGAWFQGHNRNFTRRGGLLHDEPESVKRSRRGRAEALPGFLAAIDLG